jgi:ribosomal protein L4
MNAYDIIKRPLLSEKSYATIADKKYTFVVDKNANKVEIRNAVEEIFKVKVQKVNKQAKAVAFKSAISAKLAEQKVVVLDALTINDAKTKEFMNVANSFKMEGKTVVVVAEKDEKVLRATNNIPYINVTTADLLNTYDLVACNKVYVTKDAVKKIEEAYK